MNKHQCDCCKIVANDVKPRRPNKHDGLLYAGMVLCEKCLDGYREYDRSLLEDYKPFHPLESSVFGESTMKYLRGRDE